MFGRRGVAFSESHVVMVNFSCFFSKAFRFAGGLVSSIVCALIQCEIDSLGYRTINQVVQRDALFERLFDGVSTNAGLVCATANPAIFTRLGT